MVKEIENVVGQFERGTLSRRQLIAALVAVAAAPAAAQAQAGTVVSPGLNINHVHLYIENVQRSVQFYSGLLGAKVYDTAPGNATMSLPGQPFWISLTETKEKPYINHVGYGVDFDTAKRIAADALKLSPASQARETGPTTKGPNTRSVYMNDPDGIRLQIVPKDDNGWLPTGPIGSRILKGEKP